MDDETRTAALDPAPDAATCDAAPAPSGPSARPDPPPGYDLLDEIGAGGMGVVYRARDRAFDRDVAIKLLRDRPTDDPNAVRRFLDEARITGQLQHPGIPAAHQVGTLPDGRPYLVMKLIKGRTLDAALRDRPDPAADRGRFLAAFEQVCHAVGYAHARGVIHRDLKPANVMVGAFNEVQVMDWGLAKVLGAGREPRADAAGGPPATEVRAARGADLETQAGSLLGTPAFMPPEQAVGAVDEVDARSDVFGLGAVLCVILTGRPPYAGTTANATYVQAARGSLDDAYRRLAGCGADPELVALCRRCLAADKADRPADGEEVARAVAGLRAAADERARLAEVERERARVQAAEQRKRRRVQLALAVLVGVVVCGGAAVARWREQRAADEQHRRERDAEATAVLLGQCEAALGVGDAATAGLALVEAERRVGDGDPGPLAGRLARCRSDLDLLGELDRIDTFRWTPTAKGGAEYDYPDTAAVVARWRAALADRGVRPDETPADAAADAVRPWLVRDRLLGLLDLWLVRQPSPWLRDVLHASDPDPYRDAVRGAVAGRDAARVSALAARPEALRQPVRFAAALGQLEDRQAISVERRREILTVALRDRPDDLGLLMAMGGTFPVSYDRTGAERAQAEERLRWYQAAVAARPRSVAARDSLAAALWDKGDRDGAVAEYRAAIALDPTLATGHANLGYALELQSKLEQAIAEYFEAVRLNPNDDSSHSRIAWISAAGPPRVRNGKLAVGHALRSCELTDWQQPWRIDTLAAAYAEAGEFDKAIETLKKARAFADWAKGVGGLVDHQLRLYEQKKPYYNAGLMGGGGGGDGAVRDARDTIKRDPTVAEGHFLLAEALRAKNDQNGALAAYREALRLDPQHGPAHFGVGTILRDRNDARGAVAEFKEAVRLVPNEPSAYHLLAVLLADGPADVRDPAAAVRHATRACELTEWQNVGCLLALTVACGRAGDPDRAVEYARKAVRLEPGRADARARLADALEAKGKLNEALADLREAVRLDPASASAQHHLAALLVNGPAESRDFGQAVRHATRACELTRWENSSCLETLAAAHAAGGDMDQAVRFQKKALAAPGLTPAQQDQIRQRLDAYASKKSAPAAAPAPGDPPPEHGPPPREVHDRQD